MLYEVITCSNFVALGGHLVDELLFILKEAVEILFDHLFAEVDDFIDIVGFHFQGGTDRHEDAASLLAEHFDIPVFHGVRTDVAENTGPDYGLDLLPA